MSKRPLELPDKLCNDPLFSPDRQAKLYYCIALDVEDGKLLRQQELFIKKQTRLQNGKPFSPICLQEAIQETGYSLQRVNSR